MDLPTTPYISLIYRYHAKFLNKQIKDVNLTYGLYPFLIGIYKNDGLSQEQLATLFSLNESTVTRNLNKLEKLGLIKKTPLKRKKIITITDDGVGVAKSVMDCDEKWDDIIKNELTEEEFLSFKRALIKISKRLDESNYWIFI